MTTVGRPQHSVIEQARRSDAEQGYTRINVGPSERVISGGVGAALAAYGLSLGTYKGLALAVIGGSLLYRGATGHCSLYSLLELDSAHEGHATTTYKGVNVKETVTVDRPPADCYAHWRRLENLPKFMRHVKSVRETGPTRSHWEVEAPAGVTVGWDAEIVNDRPGELIAWRSVENADVQNAGTVSFREALGGRGTEVVVQLSYSPTGGKLGAWAAKALGQDPTAEVRDDLQRFKSIMEKEGGVPAAPGGRTSP